MTSKLLLATMLFSTVTGYALVDYSDLPASKPAAQKSEAPNSYTENNLKNISVSFGIDSRQIEGNHSKGQADFYQFKAHYQTPYQVYLDVSNQLLSKVTNGVFEDNKTYMFGNIEAQIGVTWFNSGSGPTAVSSDIYFGLRLPNSESAYATTRFDKIFGFETSKRFNQFALALNYEYQLTSESNSDQELELKPIHLIGVGLGWVVSPDISMQLEAKRVLLNGENGMKDSFNYLAPQINLGLSSTIEWQLGARFRTLREYSVDRLLPYRLWSLKGVYGNSLYTNLKISF